MSIGAPISELAQAVEAIIFASDEPATLELLATTIASVQGEAMVSFDRIHDAVSELNEAYHQRGHAFKIDVFQTGFRLITVAEVAPMLSEAFRRHRTIRLSQPLLETLAIIAYKQPVTRSEVEFVRGVDADHALRRLMELRLIEMIGRAESLGRPLLFGTTAKFLDVFGIRSLDDLPTLREIESILSDPSFKRERLALLEKHQLPEYSPAEIEEMSGQPVALADNNASDGEGDEA
jgi:segregation and condensation protein B